MRSSAPDVPITLDQTISQTSLVPIMDQEVLGAESRPPLRHVSSDQEAETGLSATAILHALRRRWISATTAGVVCALVAMGVMSRLVSSTSTVRTLLHVASVRPIMLSDTPEDRGAFTNQQRAQLAMLTSRLVLKSALRDLDGMNLTVLQGQADPVAWLEKEIKGDFVTAPEILRISMKGDRPEELMIVVNAVREAFLREVVNREYHERKAMLDNLRTFASKNDEELRLKKREIIRMAEALGSRDLQQLKVKRQSTLAAVTSLQEELAKLQSDCHQAEIELKYQQQEAAKSLLDPATIEAALIQRMQSDPVAVELTGEIAKLEKDLATLKRVLLQGQRDPACQSKQEVVKSLKQELADRREVVRAEVKKLEEEKNRITRMSAVVLQQQKIAVLKGSIAFANEQIQRRSQEADAVAKSTGNLERCEEETAQLEEVGKRINNRVQALQVELQAPSRANLLEEAIVLPATVPNQLKTIVIPALGGFCLGLGGIGWLEFQKRRVNSMEEVAQHLGRKPMAALPRVSDQIRLCLTRTEDDRDQGYDLWMDTVDSTRALLLSGSREGTARLILVTSATPGEGKTSVSTNLALSLVRAGSRTLLLDANLRTPSLHQFFEPIPVAGFGELLNGTAEFDQVVQPGPVEGLDIVPIGQCDPQEVLTLLPKQLPNLFEELRQRYDNIVVDTAPVLPFPDTLLMGQYSDGVILSVLQDVSRLPNVQAAGERLANMNVRLLGTVVSGVRGSLFNTNR